MSRITEQPLLQHVLGSMGPNSVLIASGASFKQPGCIVAEAPLPLLKP
jgi:hypothetical protein